MNGTNATQLNNSILSVIKLLNGNSTNENSTLSPWQLEIAWYNNIVYYSILLPVAILGNLFTLTAVIMVLRIKKSIPNLLIGVLAFSDLTSILTCHIISLISLTNQDYELAWHWCNFQSMISYSYFKLGFLTKLTISLDRFIALKYPLRYRTIVTLKRTAGHIVFLVIFSFGSSALTLIIDSEYIKQLKTWAMCTNDWTHYTDYKLAVVILEGGFFIIGSIFFMISNFNVIIVMIKLNRKRRKFYAINQIARTHVQTVARAVITSIKAPLPKASPQLPNSLINAELDATPLAKRALRFSTSSLNNNQRDSKNANGSVGEFTDINDINPRNGDADINPRNGDADIRDVKRNTAETKTVEERRKSWFSKGPSKSLLARKENRQQKELQFAKLCVIIVTVFIILWIPNMVTIYWSFSTHVAPPPFLDDITLKLLFVNACINPILYGVFNVNFRKAYLYYIQMLAFYLSCKLGKRPSGEAMPWSVPSRARRASPYTVTITPITNSLIQRRSTVDE